MKKLKNCPFCGGHCVIFMTENDMAEMHGGNGENDGYYVICLANTTEVGCGASSGWAMSQKEARKKWNKRKTVALKAKKKKV